MRRVLITAALAIALGAAACAAGDRPAAAQAEEERPNVVVVMTDDQRADELGAMRTVRERLAGSGVTFSQAFATFPLCCPSRASFLTGQYAHNHGVLSNYWSEGGGYRAYDDSGSLPIALDRAGYRTAMAGKYLNEYTGQRVPRGWDSWAGRSRGETMFDYDLNVNGRTIHYGSTPRDYLTDVVAKRGARFIKANAGEDPLFLWASFFAPHGETLPGDGERWNPRPAPRHEGRFRNAELPRGPAFDERDVSDKPRFVRRVPRMDHAQISDLRWRWRSRQAALLSVDEGIARLLDTLERAGELADTLFVFTSDNGFLFGEHRLERKERLYEEAVRVPLIMSGPGFTGGTEYTGIVGNIDIAPTILAATGVEPLRPPDGMPLQPLVADPSLEAERDILLELRSAAAVRTPDWMYAEHDRREGTQRELYDLRADPHQLESLHADPEYAEIRVDLAERLDELRDCAGLACR